METDSSFVPSSRLSQIDVLLSSCPNVRPDPGCCSQRLFDEHYVLIGRRVHPALCPGISAAQFCGVEHVIVSLDGGAFSTPLDIGLAALGHQRKVVLSALDANLIRAAILCARPNIAFDHSSG